MKKRVLFTFIPVFLLMCGDLFAQPSEDAWVMTF